MDKANFGKLVGKLYLYFRYQKQPTAQQLSLWFEDCSFIPSIALDWIYEQFKKGDGIPRNLPAELKKMWFAYRKAHANKSIADYEYCKECFGKGTHMYSKLDNNYNPPIDISYVAACAACDNYKNQFGHAMLNGGKIFIEGRPIGPSISKIWRTTKNEILEKGYKYLGQSDPKEKKIPMNVDSVKIDWNAI